MQEPENRTATTPLITPTIGRVVWYKPPPEESDQFLPADICYVWSDHMVNLSVSNKNGSKHGRTSVTFFHGSSDECPVGACCWMPYQQKQAQKEAE